MPNLSDSILGPARRRRRRAAAPPKREAPPPAKADVVVERESAVTSAKANARRDAAAAPDTVDAEADAERPEAEEGDIAAQIDERLEGLDAKAREEVMRRVLAAYVELDPEIPDALDDEATEARSIAHGKE